MTQINQDKKMSKCQFIRIHQRYRWMSLIVLSLVATMGAGGPPTEIAGAFAPPEGLRDDFGGYRSPLFFDDGRPVRTPADWRDRRGEILRAWHAAMGAWPPLIEGLRIEDKEATHRENFTQRRVRIKVAPDRTVDGYLLVPDGQGPFPAMLVVFYEPETAIGAGTKTNRDFAVRLARRGYVTLSIGFDPREIDPTKSGPRLQPLSYLAYVASNCYSALSVVPSVDPKRVGVIGHSYGGKWAMFAACLDERFACGVWSDPGVAFDESRTSVNYWEPWYLGWEPDLVRTRGLPTADNPVGGAYRRLRDSGHDLHELQALMAPRPFLVSGGSEDTPARWKALNHVVAVNRLLGQSNRVAMTNRPAHDPTPESNAQIDRFLDYALKAEAAP